MIIKEETTTFETMSERTLEQMWNEYWDEYGGKAATPSGQKWLKCAVFQFSENGLFPPSLLIVPFGDFRKLVSSLRISKDIQCWYETVDITPYCLFPPRQVQPLIERGVMIC